MTLESAGENGRHHPKRITTNELSRPVLRTPSSVNRFLEG
jgi:hypothetical protein